MTRVGMGLLAAGIMILSQSVQAKVYYRYQDDQGGIHYLEDPAQAPPEYRDRVRPAGTDISEDDGSGGGVLKRWWRRAEEGLGTMGAWFKGGEMLPTLNLRGLIWLTLKQTWLIYSLAGEVLALILFLVGLWFAQDYPTQRERRRYAVGLILAYAGILLFSNLFLVRPQLKNFFSQSEVNAQIILDAGYLSESERDGMTRFRDSAQAWANRIP